MQKTSKLGINVTISAVGSVLPPNGTFTTILPLDGTQGWQPSYTWDEHGLLKELRDSLIYTIVASGSTGRYLLRLMWFFFINLFGRACIFKRN